MVLKKPYAFLIKYFRIIHIILAIPMIYLVVKTTNIVNFFNDYIANNYSLTINGDLSSIFINGFMYLGIFLIIISSLAVYLLFKYKEKPRKHYIAIIIYYLILFILIGVCHNILNIMEEEVIEASLARSYRDISLLVTLPQYFFCIFTTIRGLGFNIKKLNFADDLKELEISEKDSEEFELLVGIEGYKAKRTIRRFFREFYYYIIENTFIVFAILSLIIITVGTSVYLNRDNYENSYRTKEVFRYNVFSISLEDAIITNIGYNGKVVNKDNYYLILKMYLKNNSLYEEELNYSNFRIKLGDDYLFPIIDKAYYFADYATPYGGEKISPQKEDTYVFVYELSNEQLKDRYELKIYNGISYKKDEIHSRYSNIKITPLLVSNPEEVRRVKIKDTLDLTSSNIGNTKLIINNYEVTNKYLYTYENCLGGKCQNYTDYVAVDYFNTGSGSTLLVLNYELLLDKNSLYSNYIKSEKTFFDNFLSINYKLNGTLYNTSTINLTPNNIKNTLVLQVSDQIKEAEEIDVLITVRNKIYVINIK